MISPFLTYDSEVWGLFIKSDLKYWDTSLIEKGHFCKRYLQVNNKASNIARWAEFGQYPLIFDINKRILKGEWYPLYAPKSLFKFGEKRPIVCYCTHEQKMNFEGFTQNGCYGNQPQPFEVVF